MFKLRCTILFQLSDSGQHQQGDGACELNSLQVDATGDDCWERARKRARTSAPTCAIANTAAFGGADEQVLSLREMLENWTEVGAVEGQALVLSQVKQLLVAVEVCTFLQPFVYSVLMVLILTVPKEHEHTALTAGCNSAMQILTLQNTLQVHGVHEVQRQLQQLEQLGDQHQEDNE